MDRLKRAFLAAGPDICLAGTIVAVLLVGLKIYAEVFYAQ